MRTTSTSGPYKYTMHRKHIADYFHLRPHKYTMHRKHVAGYFHLRHLLQTGMEFNPSVDLWDWDETIFPLTNFYIYIIRVWERLCIFILHLYWTYDYLSVLGFQVKCVSKTD